VTWTNEDTAPHTATDTVAAAAGTIFDSGSLAKGESFSYQFNTVGDFPYYCSIHPGMVAVVKVVAP
jgi:plastocyanin